MSHLELVDLTATYGSESPVIRGVNLKIERGQIVSIVGPSGSGKSSLLRVLMGLLPPQSGSVFLHGEPVSYSSKRDLQALRDRVAIVFQQFNLFQHMTVLRNVTIGPIKIKKRDPKIVHSHALQLLAKVGLSEKLGSYPQELSGGQQQRVAIARALALNPEILLLDEVTSALDPELVNEVLDTIRVLAAEGMTMLIVSHEMAFVREVSTKVVMMDAGRIVEEGPPEQLFDHPQTVRCKDFVSKILRH
ncbi:MAG: amino acid ABC transporter ATP-binding protein [Nitrospirota bacterium]